MVASQCTNKMEVTFDVKNLAGACTVVFVVCLSTVLKPRNYFQFGEFVVKEMDPGTCTHPASAHHYDRPRGIITCMQCGDVVTEEAFELDPAFGRGEKAAVGPMRTAGFARPQRGTQQAPTGAARPSIENARKALSAIARQLDIPADHLEIAAGVYKMAVYNNCVVGARSPVLCACLYIVCRRKQTPHMILDFSDVTGDSPFHIMKYLKLICSVTGTTVPPVDPSIYLARLAQQLNLGSHSDEIALFALKILRAMRHDWIHTGRRPLGPCAAAIIVASRAYGVNRNISDVCDLVRLGQATITLRLQEFLNTEAAQLKNIDDYVPGDRSNPMAFLRGREKDSDYVFTDNAMQLATLYWELVGEAREEKPCTPEREAKWKAFWEQRTLMQRPDQMDPEEVIPELKDTSPAQQLELLGLPNERKVAMKTEEEFTQELTQLLASKELAPLVEKDATTKQSQNAATVVSGRGAPSIASSKTGTQTQLQQQQPVIASQTSQQLAHQINQHKPRDRLEVLVLPDYDDDEEDEAVDEYIEHDNEVRIQREKLAEQTYGEDLWRRGAPREEPQYEPEDPRFERQLASAIEAGTAGKRGRKRAREPIIAPAATATEAVTRGLKHRGAGQITASGIAALLGDDDVPAPGNTGVVQGSSLGGASELDSLDDEWPID